MNKLTNALFWGLFLAGLAGCLCKDEVKNKVVEVFVGICFYGTLAVCSAWCWITEKTKGI